MFTSRPRGGIASFVFLGFLGGAGASLAACSGTADAPSDDGSRATVVLRGTYQTDDPSAGIAELAFVDATHYSLWRSGACSADGDGACNEQGTYLLASDATTLTLTNATTGTPTALAFRVLGAVEPLDLVSGAGPLVDASAATTQSFAAASTGGLFSTYSEEYVSVDDGLVHDAGPLLEPDACTQLVDTTMLGDRCPVGTRPYDPGGDGSARFICGDFSNALCRCLSGTPMGATPSAGGPGPFDVWEVSFAWTAADGGSASGHAIDIVRENPFDPCKRAGEERYCLVEPPGVVPGQNGDVSCWTGPAPTSTMGTFHIGSHLQDPGPISPIETALLRYAQAFVPGAVLTDYQVYADNECHAFYDCPN